MIKFGFELECFSVDQFGNIGVPPKQYPTDGNPGLVEFRTKGGKDLHVAFGELQGEIARWTQADLSKISVISHHTFRDSDRLILRNRTTPQKQPVNIQNIYGKPPKFPKQSVTQASFQINISNEIQGEYTDNAGKYHPAHYAIVDYVGIIRELDRIFADEIKMSKRTPGCYALKQNNIRVEYRSLPNFVWRCPAKLYSALESIKHF